jgi:hypothetical protein
MTVQSHSNGSVRGAPTAMNKSSKPDQQPYSPVSPSTTESSPVTSPPYWVHSHARTISNTSTESITPGAITLQDNTDGRDDKNEACWAKGVHIDDHVVINGSRTGIGAFVVWNITVETLSVSSTCSVTPWSSQHTYLYRSCRADLYAYESDTLNLTTCGISFSRHSPSLRLLCHHCLPKA